MVQNEAILAGRSQDRAPDAEPEAKAGPRYPLTSVGNALELLMMLRDCDELRVSDVSSRLGVANSTAHRLLAMLTHHDLVQQTDSRVYVAGVALLEVGLALLNSMDARVRARAFLIELHDTFGETVHLARLDGRDVRFLDAIEGNHALRVVQRLDEVMPAHCTSVGKALLAELSSDELDRVIGVGDLPGLTPKSITTRSQLDVELDAVRSLGYATNDGESEEGISSVSATLHSATGTPLAAISVAAPTNRMPARRRREIGQALLDAAERFATTSPPAASSN